MELFPLLDWLPRPLAPWRRMGDRFYNESLQLFQDLLLHGQSTRLWNWMKEIGRLNIERGYGISEAELSFAMSALMEASATTDHVLEFFVLACILHEPAVHRVQQEIDSVVGHERLPDFDHVNQLPYLHAFVLEVLRWRSIFPLGIPHATIQDDEHQRYQILGDAIVLFNNWAMNMDEEVFSDPEDFQQNDSCKPPIYP